jgi:hypothetical protein
MRRCFKVSAFAHRPVELQNEMKPNKTKDFDLRQVHSVIYQLGNAGFTTSNLWE